jgi:hypothetical protein
MDLREDLGFADGSSDFDTHNALFYTDLLGRGSGRFSLRLDS